MKKLIATLTLLVALAAGVVVPQSANASEMERAPCAALAEQPASDELKRTSDPAGDYYYVCYESNGTNWTMADGQKTIDCKGSYLHKYVNGSRVATYALAYGGGASQTTQWMTGCVLAVAGGVALFVYPPTGATAWVVQGGLAAAGLLDGCTS
jgi:hypothetical protein